MGYYAFVQILGVEMNDKIAKMLESATEAAAGEKQFVYGRQDTDRTAQLGVKHGLLLEAIGRVEFAVAKLRDSEVSNWAIAREILRKQPHERNPIPELDIEANLQMVEQQNLFLSLLTDRLNNPQEEAEKVSTSFALKLNEQPYTVLISNISKERYSQLARDASSVVPVFDISRNNGAGNYLQFANVACLPEYGDVMKAAVIDTLYNMEIVMKHMAKRPRGPAAPTGTPDTPHA